MRLSYIANYLFLTTTIYTAMVLSLKSSLIAAKVQAVYVHSESQKRLKNTPIGS